MLATLIIVFREVIEAGLIIGIVLAATRGVHHRGRWVSYGILGGTAGACVVAAFASSLAGLMAGVGQEVFNAGILILAVLMLTWHNVWMAQHGRHMAQELRVVGEAVAHGRRSLAALAIVVGVAVLREGSEIVLFLYGVAVSGNNTVASMLIGGGMGLAGGAAISATMYFGLLRIPTRQIFAVTSVLITLLAAGMAGQAVVYLQQAGIITLWADVLWDSSSIIAQSSFAGKALHALIGYADQPTGIQIAVYTTTLITIFGLMKIVTNSCQRQASGVSKGQHP
ncbi:MAG: FTR1 family protein [Holosporales bacterium]